MLLESALRCSHAVISVMGPHAGESVDQIFRRKEGDIKQVGKTFWIIRSPKARPAQIQELCRTRTAFTIFVEPATRGGARPTIEEGAAKEFSHDNTLWQPLPKNLSLVTGKLDSGTTALVFDMMTTDVSGTLDLWEYAELSDVHKPIRFMIGCSTLCAIRRDTKSHPKRMQSRYRRIVAIARLTVPHGVWVR